MSSSFIIPIFAKKILLDVMRRKGIPVIQCPYEADPVIAKYTFVMNELQFDSQFFDSADWNRQRAKRYCIAVLSMDSDFFVFQMHRDVWYFPFNHLSFVNLAEKDENLRHRAFITAQGFKPELIARALSIPKQVRIIVFPL